MMLKRGWMIGLAGLLALAGARQALAVWSQSQVVPEGLKDWDRAMTVTTKRDGSLLQFDVTLAAKPGKPPLSPYADASLSVIRGDDYWTDVAVKPYWNGNKLEFRFKVSPKALAESRFDIREQAWTYLHGSKGEQLKDRHGKPETEMTLGGHAYWFYLKDFAGPQKD